MALDQAISSESVDVSERKKVIIDIKRKYNAVDLHNAMILLSSTELSLGKVGKTYNVPYNTMKKMQRDLCEVLQQPNCKNMLMSMYLSIDSRLRLLEAIDSLIVIKFSKKNVGGCFIRKSKRNFGVTEAKEEAIPIEITKCTKKEQND